jgi:hypothetical protein
MAKQKQKTEALTHVRVSEEKRDRAERLSRQLSAIEDRKVTITSVINEALEDGLRKRERQLGL